MFAFDVLKNHAGIALLSDYSSLRQLHEIVHDINERSPIIHNRDESAFLGLAYDLRKAYEGQREVYPAPDGFDEVGTRYGVKILWPVLLTQQRMLRVSLGYMDHGKFHQAAAFELEGVIEEALKRDFGTTAPDVIDAWHRLDPLAPDFFDRLDPRGALFCSWTKAQRKRSLPMLLHSFDALTSSFRGVDEMGDATPEAIDQWVGREWPDPKC